MSSSIAQQLVAMGFAPETASAAAGNNRNMDQALTFIQTGGEGFDDSVMDSGAQESSSTTEVVAKGFKCDECGTLLPDDQSVMDHANKTKHSKFSQSNEDKTDEQAKIKQVFDQILAGQKQKDNKEKSAEPESSALLAAQEEQRQREIQEYAEMRRRQKMEEDVHRKKVLEQIKLDQEERMERAQKASVASKEAPVVKKGRVEEGSTMLQIRLHNGKTVKQMFKAEETLATVRTWIETNHPVPFKFQLMTPFPRKEFTEQEMGATLGELNLTPSANLVVVNEEKPAMIDTASLVVAPEVKREQELKEFAEVRRRQKEEDEEHKKKLLEKIKLDQEERKERGQMASTSPKLAPMAKKEKVEEGSTMIQIRLHDGKTVKQMFRAEETLAMVRSWIETNHSVPSAFQLMTPFPRREFTDEEMEKSLGDLNLVPSANIFVVNRTPPTFKAPYPPKADEMEDSELD